MKPRGFWVSLTEPDEKKQDVCQTRAVRDKCLQLEFHKIAPRMSVPEFERGAWGNLADEWIAWEGGKGRVLLCGWGRLARRWGVHCPPPDTLSWLLLPPPRVPRTLLEPLSRNGTEPPFCPLFTALLKKWAPALSSPLTVSK